MVWFVEAKGGVVDAMPGQELICSGLGRIEFMGSGMACFVVYRNGIAPGTHEAERIECGRVFAPLDAIPEAVQLMLEALERAGLSELAFAHAARLS